MSSLSASLLPSVKEDVEASLAVATAVMSSLAVDVISSDFKLRVDIIG